MVTGGGHSPASRDYGLGADQILEAQVVLASGELVTANACQNSGLFFTVRGGGGGTYGILVSATVKAHPSTPIVAQVLAIGALTDTAVPECMEALEILYGTYPALSGGGYSGYGSWSVKTTLPSSETSPLAISMLWQFSTSQKVPRSTYLPP